MLAKLFGRPDACGRLEAFVDWTQEAWQGASRELFVRSGALQARCNQHIISIGSTMDFYYKLWYKSLLKEPANGFQ